MKRSLKTSEFEIEFIESDIINSVLWENHCHAHFEMIAVLEGDITILLEGKNYRLKKNQTVIIPPLCYHAVTVNQGKKYRRIMVLFDIGAIPKVLQSKFTKIGTDVTISFSSNIDELKDICTSEDPLFFEPLLKSLMTQIFYNALKGSKNSVEPETDVFLQKAISYIDAHLHDKILLEDLAKQTSRSKSSFCHLFEEKMKISPKQYILSKKLALARNLILDGTPPTAAAMRIGYDNYSNFYRLFIKHYGSSPSQK